MSRLSQCGLILVFCLICQAVKGQLRISGTVYDRQMRTGIIGVSVVGTAGTGTTTDSFGRYSLTQNVSDSIQFSYLGKATIKFPVKDIPAGQPFDISLEVTIDSLPTVFVRPSIYRLDSLENRREYQKMFGYSPDYLVTPNKGFGVGVSLSALLSAKKIRQMETLKHRLEADEKYNYVSHRFTRGLVRRITGLQSPALDTFMVQYRPSYDMVKSFETEYEYYKYILDMATGFMEYWRINQ